MNTYLPLILFSVSFAASDAPAPADAGAARGTVLVLENEETLTGDIEKVGELYHVRRLIGETTVPAERVLHLCANMEEACAFVRGRANLTDADERLRLAEWCRVNGLHPQALAEVKAAVDLRPDYAPARRLLAYLQESGPAHPAAAKPGPEASAEASALPVDLTEDALGQFASKVQPILMNACANCHASGRGGAFKLTRTNDSVVLNRKTLQQNLSAVLAEVNLGQPQSSPLLAKAVSVHGPQEQAPIRNRQAVAYRTLEEWVKSTVADNPQLRDEAAARPAAAAGPFAVVRPTAFIDQTAPQRGDAATPADPRPVPIRPALPPAASPTAPPPPAPAPAEAADPYSPDAFNRQFHDEKAKTAPAPK